MAGRDPRVKCPHAPSCIKPQATFCDAIVAVLSLCWETVLKQSLEHAGVTELLLRLRLRLLHRLSRAA